MLLLTREVGKYEELVIGTTLLLSDQKHRRALRRVFALGLLVLFAAFVAVLFRTKLAGVGGGGDFVRIGLVFLILVVLLWLRVPVGVALLAGSVFLALFFSLSLGQMGRAFSFGAFDAGSQKLHEFGAIACLMSLIIIFINVMGRTLRESGIIDDLVLALENVFRHLRSVAAVIPAVFGLLPMPGGALMSAPIVDELGDRVQMDATEKTVINYWFRHVWEYCWPVYPGLILAASLLENRPISLLIRTHLPITVVALAAGWLLILRRLPPGGSVAPQTNSRLRSEVVILRALWPLMLVVLAVMLTPSHLPKWLGLAIFLAVLVIADVGLIASSRLGRRKLWKVVGSSIDPHMILMVLSIYAMRGVFELSGAVDSLPDTLSASKVPAGLVVFVVPFIVGALTGYTMAAVSTTFPLLLNLLTTGDMVMLAYVGGFLGVLSSPTHLCLILTREYYRANLVSIYARIVPLIAIVAAFTAIWAAILRWTGMGG